MRQVALASFTWGCIFSSCSYSGQDASPVIFCVCLDVRIMRMKASFFFYNLEIWWDWEPFCSDASSTISCMCVCILVLIFGFRCVFRGALPAQPFSLLGSEGCRAHVLLASQPPLKGTACSLLLELTGTLGCLIEWQLFHCLGVWQPPTDFSCTLPSFRISFASGATSWTTQMWLSPLIKAFNCAETVCCNLLSGLFCDLWNTWHWSHSWLYLLQHNGCPSYILRPGQGCQGYIQQGLWWVLI